MIRDIFFKGKELADKMANIMMNYSEVEIKVREATSDEACCPHGQLMQQISDYTYSHETYVEVMATLWRRMHTESTKCWRRVYKSLILLVHLLKNGSEYVAQGARDHIYDLRTLESFRYFDEYGKDQGINVRMKVQEVIDLLQDPDKLHAERQKAKSSRHLYGGYGSSGGSGWGRSYGGSDYRRSPAFSNEDPDYFDNTGYDCNVNNNNNDIDSNNNNNNRNIDYGTTNKFEGSYKSQPIDNKPTQYPRPPKLGSFDNWHVGKERGIVDDVLEQVKEVWDMAKLSTKDIFKKRDLDYPINEANPRMVSEEVYEFPPNAVEVDGTIESNTYSDQEYNMQSSRRTRNQNSSTNRNGVTNTSVNKQNNENNNEITSQSANHIKINLPQTRSENSQTKANKPRPPSGDLIDSWDDIKDSIQPNNDLFDPFDSGNDSNNHRPNVISSHVQPNQSTSQWTENFVSASTTNQSSFKQNFISNQDQNSAIDNDFGEFTSASNTVPSFGQSFAKMNFNSFDSDLSSNSIQNTNNLFELDNSTNNYVKNMNTTQTKTSEPSPKCDKINIGSTWKELGELGIDLDSLAKPAKFGNRPVQPTLQQLKQNSVNNPNLTNDSGNGNIKSFQSHNISPTTSVTKESCKPISGGFSQPVSNFQTSFNQPPNISTTTNNPIPNQCTNFSLF